MHVNLSDVISVLIKIEYYYKQNRNDNNFYSGHEELRFINGYNLYFLG